MEIWKIWSWTCWKQKFVSCELHRSSVSWSWRIGFLAVNVQDYSKNVHVSFSILEILIPPFEFLLHRLIGFHMIEFSVHAVLETAVFWNCEKSFFVSDSKIKDNFIFNAFRCFHVSSKNLFLPWRFKFRLLLCPRMSLKIQNLKAAPCLITHRIHFLPKHGKTRFPFSAVRHSKTFPTLSHLTSEYSSSTGWRISWNCVWYKPRA